LGQWNCKQYLEIFFSASASNFWTRLLESF
jgi:hypothetical protein